MECLPHTFQALVLLSISPCWPRDVFVNHPHSIEQDLESLDMYPSTSLRTPIWSQSWSALQVFKLQNLLPRILSYFFPMDNNCIGILVGLPKKTLYWWRSRIGRTEGGRIVVNIALTKEIRPTSDISLEWRLKSSKAWCHLLLQIAYLPSSYLPNRVLMTEPQFCGDSPHFVKVSPSLT